MFVHSYSVKMGASFGNFTCQRAVSEVCAACPCTRARAHLVGEAAGGVHRDHERLRPERHRRGGVGPVDLGQRVAQGLGLAPRTQLVSAGVTTESTGVAVGKKPTSMMTLLVTAPMCRSSASSAAGHRRESVDAALAR